VGYLVGRNVLETPLIKGDDVVGIDVVGTAEGLLVGCFVGCLEGWAVGCFDGLEFGCLDGTRLG